MRFTPKTEEEVSNLLPDGEYRVRVIKAEDRQAKSGADMIALTLELDNNHKIFDYLLEAMAFKLRHFCEAANLMHKYDAGTLTASDCDGKVLTAKVFIDSKDPSYAPKNAIKDYVGVKETNGKPPGIGAPKGEALAEFVDDELPF